MKRIICFVLCFVLFVLFVAGCAVKAHAYNYQFFDTTYRFDYAQIAMPDGSVVEGEVQSWMDYENSDMIQVKIDDTTYLTHSVNVVLISE